MSVNVLNVRRPVDSVRVLAPESMHLDARAMAALGVDRVPGNRRALKLDHCQHMVAMQGGRAAGFAAFEFNHNDLLVHELVAHHTNEAVISALVTALELACLAAGGTRLFISNRTSTPSQSLEPYGYRRAPWGPWLEKSVP